MFSLSHNLNATTVCGPSVSTPLLRSWSGKISGPPDPSSAIATTFSFYNKSLLFYLSKKTWESDVGSLSLLRKTKKQPADLPFCLVTQQDRISPAVPNQKDHRKNSKSLLTTSCVSLCFPGSSILSRANSCQLWLHPLIQC